MGEKSTASINGGKFRITFDSRKSNHCVQGKFNDDISFTAKVFDKGSVHGIDKGRISKLNIRKEDKIIVNFDRGWDVEPKTPEHRAIFETITAKLNGLAPAYGLTLAGSKKMLGKLESAKEKAAIREFEVTITETLQMTVTVTAKDRREAEGMVGAAWRDGDYIIDAEHFKGVNFEATPVKSDRARSGDER